MNHAIAESTPIRLLHVCHHLCAAITLLLVSSALHPSLAPRLRFLPVVACTSDVGMQHPPGQ
jgi:hypothetical protein